MRILSGDGKGGVARSAASPFLIARMLVSPYISSIRRKEESAFAL